MQYNGKELITALGLSHLPEEEQKELSNSLLNHLETLVVDTTIANLKDKQIIEFEEALRLPSPQREERISYITSQVPGLTKAIDEAIEAEMKVIISAYDATKKDS
jgi:hypothetical protein